MIGFLTSRLGIAAISGIALAVMWAAWTIQVSRLRATHATEISIEIKKRTDVQGFFDSYKLQVEQATANQERIRADENVRALNEREAMAAEIDRLRNVNATATRQRDAASKELTRMLNNASVQDTALLGAATQLYLMRVRDAQRASPAASDSTPASGENCKRLALSSQRCVDMPIRAASS